MFQVVRITVTVTVTEYLFSASGSGRNAQHTKHAFFLSFLCASKFKLAAKNGVTAKNNLCREKRFPANVDAFKLPVTTTY